MSNGYVYEEGKYCIQDVGNLYVGTKYRFAELLEDENIPFKFRLVTDRYLMAGADLEDTLESHLYYLKPEGFLIKVYGQLRAKVKVNVLENVKKGREKNKTEYVTKLLTVKELTAISPEEKEKMGMVIQELAISKFALLGF